MVDKIYLVSPLANKEETREYCFDKCGKVIIGGIDFLEAPWLFCREDKCSYEEKSISFGKQELTGEGRTEIIVRKLCQKKSG
jgi:hypothetical protein